MSIYVTFYVDICGLYTWTCDYVCLNMRLCIYAHVYRTVYAVVCVYVQRHWYYTTRLCNVHLVTRNLAGESAIT